MVKCKNEQATKRQPLHPIQYEDDNTLRLLSYVLSWYRELQSNKTAFHIFKWGKNMK